MHREENEYKIKDKRKRITINIAVNHTADYRLEDCRRQSTASPLIFCFIGDPRFLRTIFDKDTASCGGYRKCALRFDLGSFEEPLK